MKRTNRKNANRTDRPTLPEAEVAIEKKCKLIGVNLDNWRVLNPARCPSVFQAVDAVFVPFSPQILAWALEKWTPPSPATSNWYFFQDWVYQNLGYALVGNTAVRPPKPPPAYSGDVNRAFRRI